MGMGKRACSGCRGKIGRGENFLENGGSHSLPSLPFRKLPSFSLILKKRGTVEQNPISWIESNAYGVPPTWNKAGTKSLTIWNKILGCPRKIKKFDSKWRAHFRAPDNWSRSVGKGKNVFWDTPEMGNKKARQVSLPGRKRTGTTFD